MVANGMLGVPPTSDPELERLLRETKMEEEPRLLEFVVSPNRIRQAANVGTKRDLSSADAAKFLDLFYEEFEEALGKAFRGVIERHFGVKR
jgi:hypothetical protein